MLAQREAIVARESLEVAQPCGREEEARVEEARVECAAMSERLTTARDEAAVFGQEAVAARDEAASARSQLSHMQGDHASLVAKLESGEVRKAELEALVTSLSTELQALHAQVTSATALISRESIASPTAQDASSSQRQLLTTVEQLSTEHAALKQSRVVQAVQALRANRGVQAVQALRASRVVQAVQALRASRVVTLSELIRLPRQGDEAGLRAHVAELERSVAVAAQQLEEQTSRYEQERQRVRLLVRALESRSQGAAAKDLDAKSTLAVQEMEAVQQEAAVARQEAETLREKLKKAEDEANATRQNVQSLSEKLATAEVEAKNAEDEANATRQKAQSLSEKLATAEVEASEARLQGAAAQEEAATARQQAVIAQRTAAGGQEKVAAAQEAASRLRQQVAVAWGERDVAREAAQKSEELRQAAREAQEEADVAKKELSVVQQMHAGDDSAITFDPQRRSELSLRTGASAASKKEVLRRFHFDRIYPPESTQAEVFQDAAPVVTSVLDGYNTCILAYGQTGTGKTYTIWGSASGDSRGVNARTLEALFSRAEERQQEVEYSFHVSMLEVYNEQLRDLLPRDDKPCKLEVRQGNGEVQGLQEVGPLQGGMEEVPRISMVQEAYSLKGERTSAKLWLVDLAGSERLSRTEASGQRLKEAQHINKSLSALGDCIAALSSKSAHIPYRNSKLTQLLQDSLGGDAKTLMFVQASPALPDAAETLCSLNFAARAKAVDTGPAKRHADGGSGQMKLDLSAAQKKVEELQAEKAQTSIVASALKQQLEDLSAAQKKVEELQAEKAQTSTEASALKQQLEEERRSREALEERVRELRNSPAWSTSGCTSVARYTGLAPPAVTGDPRGGRVAFEFGTSSMADISPTAATTVAKPPHSSMPVEDAAPPPNLIVPAAPPPNLVVAPAPPANPIVPVTPHPSLTAAASPFSKPKEAESATPLNSVMATAPSPIRKKRRALSTATPGKLKRKLAEPPDAEKPHPGAGLAPHKR
eukprot:gene460-839_t